jgi:hypothetical protein
MATRHALTPADLGARTTLLTQKHAEYIASFSNIWEVGIMLGVTSCVTTCLPTSGKKALGVAQKSEFRHPLCIPAFISSNFAAPVLLQSADKLEHVATEHFWMSGMYWGLTAMALMGKLDQMDTAEILDWVRGCSRAEACCCTCTTENRSAAQPRSSEEVQQTSAGAS